MLGKTRRPSSARRPSRSRGLTGPMPAKETAVAANAAAPRKIWLCADDYGIAGGVNEAIRDLIVRARLNATSVMVVAPGFTPGQAAALRALRSSIKRLAIGLHLTFTGPFRPLTPDFSPLGGHAFLPLRQMIIAAVLRRLDRAA